VLPPEGGDEWGDLEVYLEMAGDAPTIGDTVTYHVRATLPAGYELKLPESYDFPAEFSVVKEDISLKKTPTEGGTQFDLAIPLRVMRLGRLKIDEKTFIVTGPGGVGEERRAGRIFVTTGSLFADENEPAPSGALPPVPVVERNWLMVWTIGILAVVGAAVAVTLFVMNRRRKTSKPAPPARPAHEIALEKLKELEDSRMHLSGEMGAYYTALSGILRAYLGGRYGFDSLDMTTTELAERMGKAELEHFRFEALTFMLQEFDLVKFAKVLPTQTQCEQDLAKVRELVQGTAPRPDAARPMSATAGVETNGQPGRQEGVRSDGRSA